VPRSGASFIELARRGISLARSGALEANRPTLVPMIDGLRDDTLFHNGRLYTLTQHGSARDKSFQIEQVTQSTATSDQSTLEQYPFDFVLEARYDSDRMLCRRALS
jgi:galactose mutarotase-like enzyme